MLKLGYKASAEQFGPRELLDFPIEAERNGFDSGFISDVRRYSLEPADARTR